MQAKDRGRRAGALLGALLMLAPAGSVVADPLTRDPGIAGDMDSEARRAGVIAEDLVFMLDRLAVLGAGTGAEMPVGRQTTADERALAAVTAAADRAWAHTVAIAVPMLTGEQADLPDLVTTSVPGLYAVTAAGVGVVAGRDPDRVLAGLAQLLRAHRAEAHRSKLEWGMPSAPVHSVQPGLTDYVRARARQAGS